MATLRKGTLTITVPDSTAADYIAQGWQDASAASATPEAVKKPAAKRTRRPKASKPTKPVEAPTDPSTNAASGDVAGTDISTD